MKQVKSLFLMNNKFHLIEQLEAHSQELTRKEGGDEAVSLIAEAINWISNHADGWVYARKMDKLRQGEAATETTDMICEAHPWLEWPHDDCPGPGCPPTAAMILMKRRERSLQIGMQSRDTTIVDLRRRVLELESNETTKEGQDEILR